MTRVYVVRLVSDSTPLTLHAFGSRRPLRRRLGVWGRDLCEPDARDLRVLCVKVPR